MRSPDIKEPPTKMHETLVQVTGNGGWEPQGDPNPGPDPSDEGEEDRSDSCPSTVHKPSPKPDPASPIIGVEEIMPTTQVELPILSADTNCYLPKQKNLAYIPLQLAMSSQLETLRRCI